MHSETAVFMVMGYNTYNDALNTYNELEANYSRLTPEQKMVHDSYRGKLSPANAEDYLDELMVVLNLVQFGSDFAEVVGSIKSDDIDFDTFISGLGIAAPVARVVWNLITGQ
jgi:hypothetical protein